MVGYYLFSGNYSVFVVIVEWISLKHQNYLRDKLSLSNLQVFHVIDAMVTIYC